MPSPTKKVYEVLQLENLRKLRAGETFLAKDLIRLIGYYAYKIQPAVETYYELRDFLQTEIFELQCGSKVNAMVFYGLNAQVFTAVNGEKPIPFLSWSYLQKHSNKKITVEEYAAFELALKEVLSYLLTHNTTHGNTFNLLVIHRAAEKNKPRLIKAMAEAAETILKPKSHMDGSIVPVDSQIQYALNVSLQTPGRGKFAPEVEAKHIAAYFGNFEAYALLTKLSPGTTNFLAHPLAYAVYNNRLDFLQAVFAQKVSTYPLNHLTICGTMNYPSPVQTLPLHKIMYLDLKFTRAHDILLYTAMRAPVVRDSMVAFLIEQAASIHLPEVSVIDFILTNQFKASALALIKAIETREFKIMPALNPKMYELIHFVGGYEQIRVLTNKAEDDPIMLQWILIGTISQAMNSWWTRDSSLEILKTVFTRTRSIEAETQENKTKLIVIAFSTLNQKNAAMKLLQPDPVENDLTDKQRKAWFK